jgi:hypothetical protein
VPAWALAAAASVMLLLGTAGGFAAQAMLQPATPAHTVVTADLETPVEPVTTMPATLPGLGEAEVRALIQREIAGSGVMRVANTAPGLAPAVRQQLKSETESLVYERHKEMWGQVNQFVASMQDERARENKAYQLEIGILKQRVDGLQSIVNALSTQQTAKGQQQ